MEKQLFSFCSLRIIFLMIILPYFIIASGDDKKKNKTFTNDNYRYIARNEIKMWFSNNGDGSHDPLTDGNGLYWPGGENSTKGAVFEDGLVYGGKIGNEIRCNGNTYRQGFQAGKIINGLPDDPSLEKYRIYKYYKNWQTLPPGPEKDSYQLDYNQWPWQDGAPWNDVNSDSVYTPGTDYPEFFGDEIAWYVSNDMDSSRSVFTFGTAPIGIEFQTTIFQFSTNLYNDMIFKRYLMINKGNNTVDSMFVGYWADVDLGEANDDYVGGDTDLNMGYTYNADNDDGVYGTAPPAIGYDFLQMPVVPGSLMDSARFLNRWIKGFRNLDMSSFIMIYHGSLPNYPARDPQFGIPAGSVELYNYLKGFFWNGDTIINPLTDEPTKFTLTGDPVNFMGWYEGDGWPGGPAKGDRRQLMSSGPFTFAPGDTQEVIVGIHLAKGSDNRNSIVRLKEQDIDMERLYYYYFTPSLVSVKEDPILPEKFNLFQNFPNPFNPSSIIKYEVPSAGKVTMRIFNIIGREISTLVNEYQSPGKYEIKFDGSNLPAGVYFCSLTAGNNNSVIKMILLK